MEESVRGGESRRTGRTEGLCRVAALYGFSLNLRRHPANGEEGDNQHNGMEPLTGIPGRRGPAGQAVAIKRAIISHKRYLRQTCWPFDVLCEYAFGLWCSLE